MRGLLIAVAAIILVAGCAASESTPNTSPALAAVTPTPESPASASPAAPSSAPSAAADPLRAAAGVAYLAAAAPYDATINALYDQYFNATALNLLQEYCVKSSANEHAFETALTAIPVPSDPVADMAALTGDLAADEASLKPCAVATSVDSWQAAWNDRNSKPTRTTDLANRVRQDLGLPPAPEPSPS